MIELNPLKRMTAVDCLKHRFVSYLLVNESSLPTAYLDETKVVLSLDDNQLYIGKDYREKIEDLIDHKLLKERRFAQKTRLINKDIEREERKRMIEQKKLYKKKFMSPGQFDPEDEEDEEEEEENKSINMQHEVDIRADIENSRIGEEVVEKSELYISKQ